MAHTEQITIGQLRELDVFGGLPDAALDWLLNAGQVRTLAPRERFSSTYRGSAEAYCFLLRGVMAITADTAETPIDRPASASKRPPKEQRFLGYFEAGACFSNAFLAAKLGASDRPTIDCVAANTATMLEVAQGPLGDLLARQPAWRKQLAESVSHARSFFLTQQEPSRRVVQDFFLRENYVTSSVVHVGRLDRCIDCNKCYDACAERHGVARMTRIGPTLGRLTFPVMCRNCHDHPCLPVCKLGAIALDVASGDVHISDRCNGCGACARRCPNDAISMVTRKSPRHLGVVGESSPRVRYLLTDAKQCAGQQVLVVGGGDSAVVAAMALADVSGTTVSLSHRQGTLARLDESKRKRLEAYQAAGRIRVELKSKVVALEQGVACLETEHGQIRIANDVVFALEGDRQRAVKCDHCAGYADRACLTACPTGALIEVETDQLFKEERPDPTARIRRFSDALFLEGVPTTKPHRKRRELLKRWIMVLTFLMLAWIGVESFLIRTQPESSLLNAVVRATGSSFPVSFSSGRGIGHWFGYIGTVFMLASVLYSLRTRVERFKSWGSQTGWLSAHLWLGFAGATLVTYHAAFKLDRWASIACYLMWIVIVTGAVGRYAFGRVHSAVNLAEFELALLRERCAALAQDSAASGAVRALLGEDSRDGRKRWTLTVMLWEEIRDRIALLWIWASGTRHLGTPVERREMLQSLSEWAEQRRLSSYYQSAKTVLRHWNIVHIVLAIAMFILAGIHVVYGFLYKAV